jgi:hypothetical protein
MRYVALSRDEFANFIVRPLIATLQRLFFASSSAPREKQALRHKRFMVLWRKGGGDTSIATWYGTVHRKINTAASGKVLEETNNMPPQVPINCKPYVASHLGITH